MLWYKMQLNSQEQTRENTQVKQQLKREYDAIRK